MSEKVSVVVLCYNHAEYIEVCLRSVFEQTYTNIELFVYNDGSTDDSAQIIHQILKDSPFKETSYFEDKNQGVVHVRNHALERISGSLLLFVDSDNYLASDYIEKLLLGLEANQADIAYAQLWDFNNQINTLHQTGYSFEGLLEGNYIDICSLVRVSVVNGERFDPYLNNKPLEDYDFWLRLIIRHGAKPVFVGETQLNYRITEGSRTQRGDWGIYYETYSYILQKFLADYPLKITQALEANLQIMVGRFERSDGLLGYYSDQLGQKEQETAQLKSELEQIKGSTSFRLGHLLTAPVRKIKERKK